jgi:hypothetical protein
MRFQNRVVLLCFGLLLLQSVCCAQVRVEPELLQRATRVTELPADQWTQVYAWLSDHEIFLIRDGTKGAFYTGAAGPDWQAFRRDLRTGTDTPLSNLNVLLKSSRAGNPGVNLSSDGKWMLWEAWFQFVATEAARLDGSAKEIVAWPHTYYDYDNERRHNATYWIGNSHAWVEFPMLPVNDYHVLYAIVHNVDHPGYHKRIRIAPSSPLNAGDIYDACVISMRQMLSVHLTSPANSQVIYTTDLAAGGRRRHRYVLHAEPGTYFVEIVFSHRGDRVIWLTSRSEGNKEIENLWISRLDRAGKHSLGKLILPGAHSPADRVAVLQWLPDDKRISFMYQEALWTIPTD